MRCLPLALVLAACIQDSSRQHPGGTDVPDAPPPTGDAPPGVGPGSTIAVTTDALTFAIVGDTRPPMSDDTASYPTSIITSIWYGVAAAAPAVAVSTGDYVYVSSRGGQMNAQLDLYLGARAAYAGPVFAALGNHECATATASNCGPGAPDGVPVSYATFLKRMVEPLGVSTPYYTVRVDPPGGAWSAKIVVIAANAWSEDEGRWLDAAMAEPTTYTFVVRHTPDRETVAPGGPPSRQIVGRHPFTMQLVGHSHSYGRLSQKELLVGNGGAPATGSVPYGYVLAVRRDDGAIEFSAYRWDDNGRFDRFAVWPDGSAAPL
jgi:hypothetical protein